MNDEVKELLKKMTVRDLDVAIANKRLWDFCALLFPTFYKQERQYLREMCDRIEKFIENSPKHFLVVNAPPRHGKSLTAQCLTAWLFGQNPACRVMTASYNERLASVFSRSVRNLIQTEQVGERVVYSEIFPETAVKYGEAAAQMWTVEGQSQVSYLATSPNATATGFGCDFLVIDDLIKNSEEAYNENTLDDHWSWFVNTMLSRLEGERKTIVIMTRWAEGDLAGRILDAYADETELITYKCQDGDLMLCPEILDEKGLEMLKQEMNLDIFEANYNQQPIDVKGRLYEQFKEWSELPDGVVKNYTDTADTGTDYLCSINYVVFQDEAYITDLVFTDAPMERTENEVAVLLSTGSVTKAEIESNNGGRGFARNVERILRGRHDNRVSITPLAQTKNKESRILSSSAWVQNHVYMPPGWKQRFPDFYQQVMSYQRKGRNAHDDAVDVLAAIYEATTLSRKAKIYTGSDFGRAERAIFTR